MFISAAIWLVAYAHLSAHAPPKPRARPPRFDSARLIEKFVHFWSRLVDKDDDYVHIPTVLDEVDWLACVERPFTTVGDEILAYAEALDEEHPEPLRLVADAPAERCVKRRLARTNHDPEPFDEYTDFDEDEEIQRECDDILNVIAEELSVMTADWYAEQATLCGDSVGVWAAETIIFDDEDDAPEESLDVPEIDPMWGALALVDDPSEELWSLWGDGRLSPEGLYGFYSSADDDDREFPPANPGFGGTLPR
ncbi:MAG: hypothetical protein NZ534_01255 [Bacteroidia bacterium]|nr:hypothetical protein [Bacteroidia bacterium]